MHKKILMPFFLLASLSLTSCMNTKSYPLEAYRKELTYKENFKLVQLTDIHITMTTNLTKQFKFLSDNMKEANPDLIVITGDSFFEATKRQVDAFFEFFDSLNIPFAFTNGNHDHQGSYHSYYVEEVASKTKNCVFVDYKDDDLTGNMNYYIDLTDNGDLKYRLFIIDSGSYVNDGFLYDYDIIHDDQLTHFEKIQEATEDKDFTTLAFFHIPLHEYEDAYKEYLNNPSIGSGENNEDVHHGYENQGQFDRLKKMGVKGCFVGHDHINCTDLLYEDVILSYGIKSTDEIYHDSKMLGYKALTLPSDGKFSLSNIENVFKTYEGE